MILLPQHKAGPMVKWDEMKITKSILNQADMNKTLEIWHRAMADDSNFLGSRVVHRTRTIL